jgi:ATP/maltotriose-dependent transcriptional regulator MalT
VRPVLARQPGLRGFVTAFTGSNRYVPDVLAEEVLERQDEPARVFLPETTGAHSARRAQAAAPLRRGAAG